MDDVRIFGSLDSYSAFPFENFLQTIKKIIRKPSCPIQQVINRFFEANVANTNIVSRIKKNKGPNKKHNNGPLVDNKSIDLQYSEYQFPNFVLKASSPNNVCGLRNGHIILIENFVLSSTNQMCLIGKRFLEIDNFFIEPCPSSNLRIFKVWNLDRRLNFWPIEQVELKFVKFDFSPDVFVVIPLLHSEQ